MKKLIAAAVLFILLLAGCGTADKPDASVSAAGQENPETPAVSEVRTIPFISGLKADDVSEILYFDDSQPPGSPAVTYIVKEEIAGVIDMLGRITLERDVTEQVVTTPAPGDFGGYEIHMNGGNIYTVRRSGHELLFDGKRYEYSGDFVKQLHKDEVVIYAESSIGYPEDGRIALSIAAFDEEHTTAVYAPVLKQFDGNKWNVIDAVTSGSGARIPVSDITYIYLKNDYPNVTTGDFKITYDVYLPGGQKTSATAQFTIFED